MPNTNQQLTRAKRVKNDEFYTLMSDIEDECQYYTEHFRDKTIYCNCDDPKQSNFYKYFSDHFADFGLNKLITSHYVPGSKSYMTEMTSEGETIRMLQGDGDFRSDECIDILQHADIVVTNPPFSLFREFVSLMIQYEKQFIILGSMTAVSSKDIFPLFVEKKIWLGTTIHAGEKTFRVPDNAENFDFEENDQKFENIRSIRWFTNINTGYMPQAIHLVKSYTPENYPKFDTYDAIEVSKTKNIPYDYDGVMGVPITFLDKYNPEQFNIIGIASHGRDNKYDLCKPIVNGQEKFKRILIQKRQGAPA